MKQAIEMKCYFSVNSLMLKSKRGRDLISRIPYELLLPESDGPFTILNNKPIMPWEAINVRSMLGDIWKVEEGEVMRIFLRNLDHLLKAGSNHG